MCIRDSFQIECSCPPVEASAFCTDEYGASGCPRVGRENDDAQTFSRQIMVPTRSVLQQMQELEILSGTPGQSYLQQDSSRFSAAEVRQILIGSMSNMMLGAQPTRTGSRLKSH